LYKATEEKFMKRLERKLSIICQIVRASVLCLLFFESHSFAAAQTADLKDFDAFIAKTLKQYQVPGAAVAVVRDGKVIMLKGYGVSGATKPDKVDENTIFQLASITKTFTAAAAGTVVDKGKLDWDTPIFNYLPEFVAYDPYMTRYLTTRDLLAMRTGFPAFTGDALDNFGYDRPEILRRMRYFKPRYSLREVSQYSNAGFFIAGEVAARASSQSWNALVERELFAPLRMTRSGTSVKDLQKSNSAAQHAIVNGKVALVEPSNQDTMGAAGSVTSTASDLTRWMLMFLNKGSYEGKTVLKPETVKEMFKRSMVGEIEFSELAPISETTGFYYGLGFDSFDYAGHHIIEKAGALSGVRTVMTLVPNKNTGIVVLANLNLTAFPEAVRAYYLNRTLGIEPEKDQDLIYKKSQQLVKLVLGAQPAAPTKPGKYSGSLKSLLGVYENELYGRCEISLNSETLKVECGPAKYATTLKHWNNGMFVMQFPGATSSADEVTFTIGEDGNADSFTHEAFGIFARVKREEQ
jgi:CubicO group peptidase (beta-lactamase class C family)